MIAARSHRRYVGSRDEVSTREAKQGEAAYKNEKALKDAYDFDDLPSFLAIYYEGMSVLLT